MIALKRVYERVSPDDGVCFLVERLWPRGIKKESLKIDAWLKDVAPSTKLRTWFGHDPQKWQEFRTRYFKELDANPEEWAPIRIAAMKGRVTLYYSSRDETYNNAVALKEYIDAKL